MKRFLTLFAIFIPPWSAGDAVLYWHGAALGWITDWDIWCWTALIWTFYCLTMEPRR